MNYKLGQEELQEKLDQQLRLIHASIDKFDGWFIDEALRLATSLRILLHDTDKSQSLLKQLWIKNKILFYDSSLEIPQNNWVKTHYRWLATAFVGNRGAREVPILDDNPKAKKVDFDVRWNGIIFVDMNWDKFSRKDIVLFAANQDGWAHIDGKIREKNANLSRKNSLWVMIWNGKERKPMQGLDYTAIRQITHELLKSLDEKYTCERNLSWESWFMVWWNVSFWTSPAAMSPRTEKIWRNDPCSCWSWKKYKKCYWNI